MASDPSLAQAIQTLRTGNRIAARSILTELTQAEPLLAEGWLWLAAACDDPTQKRAYLQQALGLNPADQRAQAALRALDRQAPTDQADTPPAPSFADSTIPVIAAANISTTSRSPYAKPQFAPAVVPTGRNIPWTLVALVCLLIALIPLTLLFI